MRNSLESAGADSEIRYSEACISDRNHKWFHNRIPRRMLRRRSVGCEGQYGETLVTFNLCGGEGESNMIAAARGIIVFALKWASPKHRAPSLAPPSQNRYALRFVLATSSSFPLIMCYSQLDHNYRFRSGAYYYSCFSS